MPSPDRQLSRTAIPELGRRARGGPLVAVVGLTGGAGVSTLTYLLALAAAQASEAHGVPVLACDTGGATAGLSLYAGVEAPHPLSELADRVAARRPLSGHPFAAAPSGLRVLATGPQAPAGAGRDAIERILLDARAAHGLTVVDCGTLARPADRVALEAATHAFWMLPATVSGVRRAQGALACAPARVTAREVLVARAERGETRPALRALAELADGRDAPLVLMPHVADLGEHPAADAICAAQVALQAIAGILR